MNVLRQMLLFLIVVCPILAKEDLAKKQVFVYNSGAAPSSLDPHKVEGAPEGHFIRNLFETLIISDSNDKILPGVAYKWEHSPDYKTWTFYLRKDAKWSNGDLLTADDFVFAWRRLVDPKTASPYASYLNYMKLKNSDQIIKGNKDPKELGVKAKDAHTLVLELEEPIPYADILTEFYVLAPVPKKLVQKLGDQWSDPKNIVGNGAFKLDSLVINEKGVLSKNTHYWDSKNVKLEKLIFLQIPNEATALARYRAGDLDVATFPPELSDKVKKEYPKELSKSIPVFCTYYYEFNSKKKPFNDERVRKALAMALDRNIITEKILRQGQQPAYVFTPPNMNQSEKITSPDWTKTDPQKRYAEARKLLQEAGYSKSKPLVFELLYNTNENHKKIASAAATIWKKNLGNVIQVKLVNQEWKTFLSSRRLGNFEVARAGWCSDYNEASSFLNILISDSSNNRSGFASAEYDAVMQKAILTKTDLERAQYYAQAEEILAKNAPIMPIFSQSAQVLIKPYVRGFVLKPSNNLYFKDVYIVRH